MCWDIIDPETDVVDSGSICAGNVLVQPIHPGMQPRLQGISTHPQAVYLSREREKLQLQSAVVSRSSSVSLVAQW